MHTPLTALAHSLSFFLLFVPGPLYPQSVRFSFPERSVCHVPWILLLMKLG